MTTSTEPQAPIIDTTAILLRRTSDEPPQLVAVLAERTRTDGLVVTPLTHEGQFTGDWNLTHGPSGMTVPIEWRAGVDIHTVRRVAEELGTLGIDWTLDQAALAPVLKAKTKEIIAAVRRGQYPAPAPDDLERGQPATAAGLARLLTKYALTRAGATWEYIQRTDDDGRRINALNTAALLHTHGLVRALRTFAGVDAQAADALARDIQGDWNDGGSVHEWVGVWGAEYGFGAASPTDFDKIPKHVRDAGRAKLNETMPASGETFDQLRQMIAEYAQMGARRFSEQSARALEQARAGHRSDDETAHGDEKVAHGCSFFGFALLSVLSRMAKEMPAVAASYARMVDDIGINGGCPHTEDMPWGDGIDHAVGDAG